MSTPGSATPPATSSAASAAAPGEVSADNTAPPKPLAAQLTSFRARISRQLQASRLRKSRFVTDAELTDLFDDDPTEMASFQFTDPITGGVICLTFDCWMHRVGPELSAAPRRKTGSSIFVVFNGSGSSTIGDTDYDWETGDIFVVPSWAPVQHHPDEVSNLFEMTDRPVMKAVGLYREETLDS